MGTLQLRQIQHRLDTTLVPLVDISDLAGLQVADQQKNALSRALAAFVVQQHWGWSSELAAAAVTDGPHDGGLDAIAVDPAVPRILLVQSKWSSHGSASKAEMVLFRDGIDRLVKSDWDYFNAKIQARKSEIEEALFNAAVRIDLVFAHSGSGSFADEVSNVMTPQINGLNEFEEVAAFHYFDQARLLSLLTAGLSQQINLNVELSDWGDLEGPPRAFYGHVATSAIAKWFVDYGDALFSTNLRSTLPDSSVNDAIMETVQKEPELFWYFNNGVTVLCEEVVKSPAGGSDRRVGHFEFRGSQVVNGAQTVGTIARALGVSDQSEENPGRVMVRFIELAQAQEGFGVRVTRSTNTQNRVGGREFLALDPEQVRIAREFEIDDRHYVYRSGEADPNPEDGCGVQEATIALACIEPDIRLTVQAKREASRMWADVERPPYKTLFNPDTHSLRVWRAVQVLRTVEHRLNAAQTEASGRAKNYLVYLNRAVLWAVSKDLDLRTRIDDPDVSWEDVLEEVTAKTEALANLLPAVAEFIYPGYPANLAKNAAVCQDVMITALSRI
jgi:hypothetical protein